MDNNKWKRILEILSIASNQYASWADEADSESYEIQLYNLLILISKRCPSNLLELELEFPFGRLLDRIDSDGTEWSITKTWSLKDILDKDFAYKHYHLQNKYKYSEIFGDLEYNDWTYLEDKTLTKEDFELMKQFKKEL